MLHFINNLCSVPLGGMHNDVWNTSCHPVMLPKRGVRVPRWILHYVNDLLSVSSDVEMGTRGVRYCLCRAVCKK